MSFLAGCDCNTCAAVSPVPAFRGVAIRLVGGGEGGVVVGGIALSVGGIALARLWKFNIQT